MSPVFSATHSPHPAQGGVGLLPPECLAFRLDEQAYGVDMRLVQELRGYGAVASLGGATGQGRRWLDLRGARVPCIELRSALGLPVAEEACAVVVVAALGARLVCFTADGVLGVRRSDSTQGAARVDDVSLDVRTTDHNVLRLLDLHRLLAADALDECADVLDGDGGPKSATALGGSGAWAQWRATDNSPSIA